MRNHQFKQWGVFGALLVLFLISTPINAAVVYDNTATPLGFNTPIRAFVGVDDPVWRGDVITLQGPERVVTEFLFGYSAPINIPSTAGVLRFYANDGPSGAPGTILFETTFQYQAGQVADAVFTGLSVLVPDTFTWAVELPLVALRYYDPPTVGSSGDFYWASADDTASWFQINTSLVDNLRARVTASVSEPESLALVLVGLVAAGVARRRK